MNHLTALGGADLHIDTMRFLRVIYRNPVIEPVLLIAIGLHILSGIGLIWIAPREGGGIRLQKLSGGYLAVFLMMHLGGGFFLGRIKLKVDTNFYFAATPLLTAPYQLLFIPYYSLAVVAVFAHGAYIWNRFRQQRGKRALPVTPFIVAGAVAGLLIVASLGGLFYEITVPAEYQTMFD